MLEKEKKPYKDSFFAKKRQIERMFDNISPTYDLLNRILSFGIDLSWRRKVLRLLYSFYPKEILDVATGTGDLAIMAARGLPAANVTGLDLSDGMLKIARRKVLSEGLRGRVGLMRGDSENMPFESERFDVVTVGFGVRNFERLEKGLGEIFRVLKPGGIVIILEFSQPKNRFVRFLYRLYSYYIKFIGRIISKDAAAYDYLPRSIAAFPHGVEMANILRSCGFPEPSAVPLTFGVASIYLARKG